MHLYRILRSTNNYMNPDDFQLVLDAIPMLHIRKWKDEDIRMLFKILYWVALRPVEGIELKKEDVDLESRNLYLGNTKTRNNDAAPIPRRFVPELSEYLSHKKEGRLFDGLTYNTFYPWLKKLGVILDIEAWTTPQQETKEKTVGHIFRKSLGKDMVYGVHKDKNNQKFEIPIISKQLRHSKPSITIDHYLKASIESVKDVW